MTYTRDIDVTRDVRTNLCNTTFTFSLIYFALSDACRCQVIILCAVLFTFSRILIFLLFSSDPPKLFFFFTTAQFCFKKLICVFQ